MVTRKNKTSSKIGVKSGRDSFIAITGMASLFPDARNLHEFWNNILIKKDSIVDITTKNPKTYWDKEFFYDKDPKAPDKTYAHKAGFIPEIEFDPVEFKIPPRTMEAISTVQLFGLYVARLALADAQMLDPENSKVARDKTGVILGVGGIGNTGFSVGVRQQFPVMEKVFKNAGFPDELSQHVMNKFKDISVEWQEDTFPGFLGNVVSGRIASYFDLSGTSCTIDAACASSLAAVKMSICELLEGSCDAVLTGGVNVDNSLFSFLCFSKTPALSIKNQIRPYDAESDGMMLGDGVGMIVIKRLEDAERDGDRIYAVIRGMGSSSDGRAKSIFAPRFEGQVKTLNRAYDRAGVNPKDIQLIEGHGTGTIAGDTTEFKSIADVFKTDDVPNQAVALGSIKSQIGHTRTAAGAASLIKAALAIHQKVLPPTINVKKPNPQFNIEESPFYINTEARPWIKTRNGPRRAGVSAFGFGGTNYHMVLEEYEKNQGTVYRMNPVLDMIIIHDTDPEKIITRCKDLLEQFESDKGELLYYEYVIGMKGFIIPDDSPRLGFVAQNREEACEYLKQSLSLLETKKEEKWDHPKGIYYRPKVKPLSGRVVVMFPGQGAQYLNMISSVAQNYPEVQELMARVNSVMQKKELSAISQVVYPVPAFDEETRKNQEKNLTRTLFAQPAIASVSSAFYTLLKKAGFSPDYAVGHSFGELTALWAAGALDDEAFFDLAAARGQAMDIPPDRDTDPGAMLAVSDSIEEIEAWIGNYDGIQIANYNSPTQIVLGGATDAIEKLHQDLKVKGKQSVILPVAAAFHTPFVKHAQLPFTEKLDTITFAKPKIPVYANISAKPYSDKGEDIRLGLSGQLCNPVRFSQSIEAIHAAGGDLFVEIGPKGILSKLVENILKNKEYSVVTLNPSSKKEGERQFRQAVVKLQVEGIPLKNIDPYERKLPVEEKREKKLSFTLDGGAFINESTRERREKALNTEYTSLFEQYKGESRKETPQIMIKGESTMLEDKKEHPISNPLSGVVIQASKGDESVKNEEKGAPVQPVIQKKSIQPVTSKYEPEDTNKEHLQYTEYKRSLGIINAHIDAQNMLSQVHNQFQDNQRKYIDLLEKLIDKQHSLINNFKGDHNLGDVLRNIGQSYNLLEKNQESNHASHEKYFQNQMNLLIGNREITEQPVEKIQISNHQLPSAGLQTRLQEERPGSTALQPITARPKPETEMAPLLRDETPFGSAVVETGSMKTRETQPPTPSPSTIDESQTDELQVSPKIIEALESFDSKEFEAKLIKVVSEKTGYPPEMIDVDMDLEADMGIDSIKRVEILGSLAAEYPDLPEMEMDPEEMENIEFSVDDFKTLKSIIEYTENSVIETKKALEEGSFSLPSAGGASTGENESKRELELAHSKEKPTSNRGEEPLEADQSISSGVQLYGKSDKAADSTMGFVSISTSSPSDVQLDLAKGEAAEQSDLNESHVKRYKVIKKVIPEPDRIDAVLPKGHIWIITDDGNGFGIQLLEHLTANGHRAVLLVFPDTIVTQMVVSDDQSFCFKLSSASEAALTDTLKEIQEKVGPVGGFIHVNPLYKKIDSIGVAITNQEFEISKLVFLAAKTLQKQITQVKCVSPERTFFVTVSRMDGELGLGEKGGFGIIGGGLAGLVKSLNREWPAVFCRHVDIDPTIKNKSAVSMICEELFDSQTSITEVGRNKNERCTIIQEESDIDQSGSEDSPPRVPGQETVFLVTGGGRGITARCVIELAKTYKSKFIIVGRTDITAPEPEWASGVKESDLKSRAVVEMKNRNERPTPAAVDKMIKKVVSRREIAENLAAIEQAGSKVVYISMDITNSEELETKIEDAEETVGTVNGVIHGAGNLADKRIEKKTQEDFSLVFGTKILGLQNIIGTLGNRQIDFLLLFSSIAGYIGNAGQTDYAMANESLNKFAHCYAHFYKNRAIRSIDWGPWESGMVNETLKKAYEQLNIKTIPLDIGASLCAKELSGGRNGSQILINAGRIIGPVINITVPERLGIKRKLANEKNPFLQHHKVDDKPVLPATCAIGWLIKGCTDLFHGYSLNAVRDFKVLKGIIFEEKAPKDFVLTLKPELPPKPDKPVTIYARIESHTNKKKLPDFHYEGIIQLSRRNPDSPVYQNLELNKAGTISLPLYRSDDTNGILFHGQDLHGIQEVINISSSKITSVCNLAPIALRDQGQFQADLFNPFIADVQLHSSLVWLYENVKEGALPLSFRLIEQFDELDFNREFFVSTEIRSVTSSSLLVDIIVSNRKGKVFTKWTDVAFTILPRLRENF